MPELLPKQEFDKLTRAINRLHRETIVSLRRFRLWTQDDARTQPQLGRSITSVLLQRTQIRELSYSPEHILCVRFAPSVPIGLPKTTQRSF